MIPMVAETCDDPVVATVFDRLKKRWGVVLNLYRVLAWSPPLLRAWAPFAWSLRFEMAASRKLRELLIVRIAALLNAEYEYAHHLHLAREAGVSEAQIAELSAWQTSNNFDDEEKAVLLLADDLALRPSAAPDTMRRLNATFSQRDCVELLVTGAFYCGVAKVINSADVALEQNWSDLRPRDD